MLIMTISVLAALALDWISGEPRRYHPLVGFGKLAEVAERRFYGEGNTTPRARRWRGISALSLLLVPITIACVALSELPYAGTAGGVILLYLAIGHKSLHEHARPIVVALQNDDGDNARRLAGFMVSRDPATLNIPVATTESVLENGNDSVFAALFWFTIAGAGGVVFYRLANTLDAMWGYRDQRYRDFGWAAARLDDVMNFIPARLTALTYALVGKTRQALTCWLKQAPAWDSPNAGPVMAAGAGALGVSIGGPASYQGVWHQRPILGVGPAPTANDIERVLKLVRQGVWLWLGSILVIELMAS